MENVSLKIVKINFIVLDNLFLKGDKLYVSERIYRMNGRMDYSRMFFTEDKKYLGEIADRNYKSDYFE